MQTFQFTFWLLIVCFFVAVPSTLVLLQSESWVVVGPGILVLPRLLADQPQVILQLTNLIAPPYLRTKLSRSNFLGAICTRHFSSSCGGDLKSSVTTLKYSLTMMTMLTMSKWLTMLTMSKRLTMLTCSARWQCWNTRAHWSHWSPLRLPPAWFKRVGASIYDVEWLCLLWFLCQRCSCVMIMMVPVSWWWHCTTRWDDNGGSCTVLMVWPLATQGGHQYKNLTKLWTHQ